MSTMTMTRPATPRRGAAQPVPTAVAAWQDDIENRLEQQLAASSDREAQMDARRRAAGIKHAEDEVRRLLAGDAPRPSTGSGAARAVVVHRSSWLRDRLVKRLQDNGVDVVGQGEDGAVALAAALVEQPEVLVIEGLLPWVTPTDVVQDVRRFAPKTFVVVVVEGPAAAEQMIAAGAHAVYSRAVPPTDVADAVARALREAAGSDAPRVSA